MTKVKRYSIEEAFIKVKSYLRDNEQSYQGTNQGCIQKIFPGGGKLGPHKRMTLAIMIIAYIYTSICLLRFA